MTLLGLLTRLKAGVKRCWSMESGGCHIPNRLTNEGVMDDAKRDDKGNEIARLLKMAPKKTFGEAQT